MNNEFVTGAIEILAMTVNQISIKTLSQHRQIITTNSLLTSLPDEIIDGTINDGKHYFTDHVWYELLQSSRGISKYAM